MKHTFGLVAAATAAMLGWSAAAQTVSISTLPPGSVNNVQTQAVAKVVQEVTGIQMRVVGFNSPEASMSAVEYGEALFSFMSNDEVGIAVRGQDVYEGEPLASLRLVATVFPFKVGTVVRADSDIHTIADLRGKRFPSGWDGFPQGVALSSAMLATSGLSFDDVQGVPTTNLLRAADDLQAGVIDATVFAIGAPKMAELDAAIGIRFLSLDSSDEANARMAAVRPEYHVAQQAAAPNLHGVADGAYLMEYAMTVITRADADEEMIYTITKAIHQNRDALIAAHPSYNAMDPAKLAIAQDGVEHHPGAIRYYREAGIWPAE